MSAKFGPAGNSDAFSAVHKSSLAAPQWSQAPVAPGDQDPNAPFRIPAAHADRADMPTQAEVDAEIDREDAADATADAPDPTGDPDKKA